MSGIPIMSPTRRHHHSSGNEPPNQRCSNLIYDSELFLTKLREFKPQSLGCLEARRKSSSTLIFPSPQQACMGPPKCSRYPHHIKPTPGYWIECHGSGSASVTEENPFQTTADARLDSENRASTDQIRKDDEQTSRVSDLVLSPDRLPGLRFKSLETRRSAAEIQLSDDAHSDPVSDFPDGSSNTRFKTHQRKAFEAADVPIKSAKPKPKLNKRTRTRDDIDLHKPRHGMPNITITGPSFNQSTTKDNGFRSQSRAATRQDSRQSGHLSRFDSTDDSTAHSVTPESVSILQRVNSVQEAQRTSPELESPTNPPELIATPIERSQTDDDDSSKDPDSRAVSRSRMRREDMQGQEHEAQSESQLSTISGVMSPIGTTDYMIHRQHRPSIIREDSGAENNAAAGMPGYEGDSYHGLSTTSFQKRPFQHHLQQQQQQQFQQSEQFENKWADSGLELISFEEENYEKHYYGREHWNYFTNDELLGPVMLSLKQEVNNQRDHFHVLLRTVSYTLHGTIPASTICADRYDREAIVRELSEIAKLKPPLMLGQLPTTPDDLLKLDHIFIKTELKVGVIYIKDGQAESEEAILGNKEESPLFNEFLDILGDRITLKGFDRYKGGLDTVHNLTGTESIYTMWRNIEIMFHVSTMLPHEENDPQKLQKKRHIGNDIVCVAFIESDDTLFWPGCIKSYFLHTFITVQTSPKPPKEGEKRKYLVSCVCRNEVQYAFKPYLIEQDEFYKSDFFREWLLVKIVNGERASYSAPKFARMQDRTRSQLLEDIITNLANHLVTGQIPKPYRRGSWRPLGHTRASSPLEDSMKDYFEDYDQLAKDFSQAFCGPSRSMLCDVVFRVKDKDGSFKLVHGVRAIMAIRSRTFLEMLYGFVPFGAGPASMQNQTNLRAIEMKALTGDSGSPSSQMKDTLAEPSKSLLTKRGSFGADSSKRVSEKERRQSMLPNLSKSVVQKPNYLTVPSAGSGAGGTSGTGGMIKNAFNRLVSGNWSGWSATMKSYKGEPMHIKVDPNKAKVDLGSLAICKEIAKFDADKLSQREFEIREFDYETFQQTIEYIHNGQCKLSYETIPGLICAAEHYDLPDLLHACFHHANTHMKLSAAPQMMNALYQNSCFYVTAMQLLDSIYEYIDPQGNEFFTRYEYLELHESVFTALLSRKTLQVSELKRFQAMNGWARNQVDEKLHKRMQQIQRQSSLEQHQQTSLQQTDVSIKPDEHQPLQLKISLKKNDTPLASISKEEREAEYLSLMNRLNKEINIKLDKISNEELVKIVLPTKFFNNDKIFEIMADESRMDY